MSDNDATLALYQLSDFLYRYYGKKVIILLDEYDTPMQEAYVDGFSREGNEPSDCLQAFGDCPRAHGSENHERDELVGFISDKYATSFGFTEEEVFAALEECGLSGEKEQVKQWYDGFILGLIVDMAGEYVITSSRESGS